jgi:hypothetical protein
MLNNIITLKKNQWLQSKDCSVIELINYIKNAGKLRDTQIEAIETYLFLKIQGENKPLWQLFSEGFFNTGTDLAQYNVLYPIATNFLLQNKSAYALFDFASYSKLTTLTQLILKDSQALDYDSFIKNLFYNVNYPDYLMSLPMGAGKTYLMAAFIYLDLYFANNEPDNKNFAHNFLVLIPSGLKSSIIPSLRTIEYFDPSWVLPEPAASKLKQSLKLEVLDEAKSAKRSNKAQNPNSQKVQACFPNPFGRIFIVNAEKVILNRIEINANHQAFERTDDEQARFDNELRHLIGTIPNLSILIDEVHHAATDEIKLRQVVNNWYDGDTITTVLGFSGTPYLQKADKIKIKSTEIKLAQITNTVYYYPLLTAIKTFLKTPVIKSERNLGRFEIIKQGITEFDTLYKDKVYHNGTIAKLAIYCSNIAALREEILPFLIGDLNINPDEILEYHGGNKQYSLPKENELEFRSLNLPLSKKRYILLVQVGKEGWDCPSLTGVILSQKGDSPQNMVLQTACRCLRQVDKNSQETALIWLNNDNAITLNNQLKQEQNTSIEELNNAKQGNNEPEKIARIPRIEHLKLPPIDFYQLKITYQAIESEQDSNTKDKLNQLLATLESYKTDGIITTRNLYNWDDSTIKILNQTGNQLASYAQWLFSISRASFGTLMIEQLHEFDNQLKLLFEQITYSENGQRFFNDFYDLYHIESLIRSSFSIKRELITTSDTVKESAQFLIIKHLTAVAKNDNLYPNEENCKKIIEFDNSNAPLEIDATEIQLAYDTLKQIMESQGLGQFVPPFSGYKADFYIPDDIKQKDKSFHYLPYDFGGSGSSLLEFELFKKTLSLEDFKQNNLEIYYNGERGLTEFVINCFTKKNGHWKNDGNYTPDFLVIRRDPDNNIHKVLIIEAKGSIYADKFKLKKEFMNTFINSNNEKFGYPRFSFLYLEDSQSIDKNIVTLNTTINQFFDETS